MKLRGKLPKDDANGVEGFETELAGNLMNGKTVLVMALLGTEDVLARRSEPIVTIVDIEGVPEEQRSHLLDVMSAIKSERMNRAGRTPLNLEPTEVAVVNGEPLDLDDPDGSI